MAATWRGPASADAPLVDRLAAAPARAECPVGSNGQLCSGQGICGYDKQLMQSRCVPPTHALRPRHCRHGPPSRCAGAPDALRPPPCHHLPPARSCFCDDNYIESDCSKPANPFPTGAVAGATFGGLLLGGASLAGVAFFLSRKAGATANVDGFYGQV